MNAKENCIILKKIGEGTFGKVFLCKNLHNDKYFTVKRISFTSNDFVLLSVQREFKILSSLTHPRIVQYYGFYQTMHSWNFVLEYVVNGNLGDFLTERLDRGKYFSFKEVLNIFIDILAGVKYLHYCSIIHRDIKPENVLMDKYYRAKLSDFGISKFIKSVEDLNNMTNIGSPHYMAPEVIQGKQYGFKCDIWSLGIILYELCTLQHPDKVLGVIDFSDSLKLEKKFFRKNLYELCKNMLKPDPNERLSTDEIINHSLIRNKYFTVFLEK